MKKLIGIISIYLLAIFLVSLEVSMINLYQRTQVPSFQWTWLISTNWGRQVEHTNSCVWVRGNDVYVYDADIDMWDQKGRCERDGKPIELTFVISDMIVGGHPVDIDCSKNNCLP